MTTSTTLFRRAILVRTAVLAAGVLSVAACKQSSVNPVEFTPTHGRIYFYHIDSTVDHNFAGTFGSVNPDGSDFRGVSPYGIAFCPPAHGYLAYASGDTVTKRQELQLMRTDGVKVRTLLVIDSTTYVTYPVISPDARHVAVGSALQGSGGLSEVNRLLVINADGTNATIVATNLAHESQGAFSPDASRIAYAGRDAKVYVIGTDGTGARVIADSCDTPPDNNIRMEWSPAGDKVVFVGIRNGYSNICVANADGSGTANLTNLDVYEYQPAWSPDGAMIAFVRNAELFVMNADGTNARKLIGGVGSTYTYPSWSGDSKNLAIAKFTSGNAGEEPGTLYTVNVATGAATLVNSSILQPFWER